MAPFHSLFAQTAILDSLSLMRDKNAGTAAEVKVLTDLAWYAKEARLYEAAIDYAWQGRHLGQQYDDLKGIANAWNVLGAVYYKYGQYDLSLGFHDSAEVVFRQTKDTTGLVASLHNQSMVYGSMDNCLEALALKKECIQALKHEEKYLRRLMILRASHVNDLSNCYHYHTVLELGKPLLREMQEGGFEEYTGSVFNAIGVAHIFLGEFDSALVWLERGSETMQAMGDTMSAIVLLSNQGMAHFEAKNYERALEIYTQVGQVEELGQTKDFLDQLNLGLCHAKLGDFAQAKTLLEPGIAYLEREEILEMLPEAYVAIGETYAGLGDSAQAYSPLIKAFAIADSLRALQRFARIQEMNTQFENERIRFDLERADLEIKLREQRIFLLSSLLVGTILLALVLYLIMRITSRRKSYEAKRRQVELEYGLLRSQMNPHFVFNALNSIQGFFAERDFLRGNEYLGAFGLLIRKVLEQSAQTSISLEEELDTLNLYLQLEKTRLKGHLHYQFDLDEEIDPSEWLVPPMVLQPFVENAIWHGIAPMDRPGQVVIRIRLTQDEQFLEVEVEDDGVGLSESLQKKPKHHQSKGISITRERLGKGGQVSVNTRYLKNGEVGGTLASLRIPIREEE